MAMLNVLLITKSKTRHDSEYENLHILLIIALNSTQKHADKLLLFHRIGLKTSKDLNMFTQNKNTRILTTLYLVEAAQLLKSCLKTEEK